MEKSKKNVAQKPEKKQPAAQQQKPIQFNENDYESDNLYNDASQGDGNEQDEDSDDDGSSEDDVQLVGQKRGADKKSSEGSEPNYKRQRKY